MLPIEKVVIEYGQFDVHKLVNPDVQGKEYQEGPQKGYANEREYVLHRDRHTCRLCKKTQRELHVHHVLWQSQGGSDVPENLLTLCVRCHNRVHKNPKVDEQVKELFESSQKRYAPPTLLNTIMPELYEWLGKEFQTVQATYGYETKEKRRKHELKKEHYIDAYLASLTSEQIEKEKIAGCVLYEFQQFRRHNRQLIHARRDRNYYEDKRDQKNPIVAKNRHKRMGQTSDSLAEYVAQKGKQCLGMLRVTRGQKMIRSKKEKFKPGDVVLREDGTQRIVTGSGHNGYSVTLLFEKKYEIASKCRLLAKNNGLVCVKFVNGKTQCQGHTDAMGTA